MSDYLFICFENMLNSLRDFPDRDLILKITKFAEEQIHLSTNVADMLLAKIIDPTTNITFKVPIFYCMDSIMKNVGGPYAALFSRYLLDVFSRAYDEVTVKDKERLNKMLIFWEERKILPLEIMLKMRHHINSRKIPIISSIPAVNTLLPSRNFEESKPRLQQGLSNNFNGNNINNFTNQAHNVQSQNTNNISLNKNLNNKMHTMSRHDVSYNAPTNIPNNKVVAPFDLPQSHFANAFICERPVVVDLDRAREVCTQIRNCALSSSNNEISFLSTKLNEMLVNVNVRPALPPLLFGPLPLKPTKHFGESSRQINEDTTTNAMKRARPMMPIPTFRLDELNKKPIRAVQQLYTDRPHQYMEDGVRFKTLQELVSHTDTSLTRKEALKKKELGGEKSYRIWYEKASQWLLETPKENVNPKNDFNIENANNGLQQSTTKETYVVPADESFPRCVICKELFETIWDQDEGELYCNNAVKLLVTEKSNSNLYKECSETPHELVRYCIVHMDGCSLAEYLEQGRVDTLKKAKSRYKHMKNVNNETYADMLTIGAGGEDDEDDIFCTIELT